jgi:hypothetical protein
MYYNLCACTYTEMTLRNNAGAPAKGKIHGVPEIVHSKTFNVLKNIKILVLIIATKRLEALISRLSSQLCPYLQIGNGISTTNKFCRQHCNTFLPDGEFWSCLTAC